MTLVIACRNDEKINIVTDSRLILSGKKIVDGAVKIMQIPIRLKLPKSNHTGLEVTFFESTYAMAFAGNTLSATIIKETISDFLTNAQSYGSNAVSFTNICNIVKRISILSSEKIFDASFGLKGGVEFLLIGKCPTSNFLSAAKFNIYMENGEVKAEYDFVLEIESDSVCLGDGAKDLDEINNISSLINSLTAMETVINNQRVKTVGGDIQVGVIDNSSFIVRGIIRQQMEGADLVIKHKVRGIDLNKENASFHDDGLYISYKFLEAPPLSQVYIDKKIAEHDELNEE